VRYEVWEKTVPEAIKSDQLWSLRIYRTALYAGETARRDAHWLASKPACAQLAQQLASATESISVNIAEGYSRAARQDRGRFFEYALGSAREARDWYFKARPYLGPHATNARLALLTTIIKVMIVLVSKSRPMAVVMES
jgi:four helix bundle protein